MREFESLEVIYQQRLVAVVSPGGGARLEPHVEALDANDPDRRFIQVMTAYATAVLDGEAAGPFASSDAEAVARVAMLPDEELAFFEGRSDQEVAAQFALPLSQVVLRRQELQGSPRSRDG